MPHTPRLYVRALCRYYAALARNIKLLKLPVFSELFKFPPSFKADLIAYAGAMEQRQAETCSMAVSFHKNTFVRVSPSLGYECVRVWDVLGVRGRTALRRSVNLSSHTA